MKTTLDINDALLANAKSPAAQQRTALTRLIEAGLQLRRLARRDAPRQAATCRLPVFKGRGGLVSGIDPLSNKSMLGAEWPVMRQLCLDGQLRANALPDAWLAAAVVQHGEHLATFDSDFRKLLRRSQLTVLRPA